MWFIIRLFLDIIKRTVFGKEFEVHSSERPSEGLDCSCVPFFNPGHPPDLNRLIRILEDVRDEMDSLSHLTAHFGRRIPMKEHIDWRMSFISQDVEEMCNYGKLYSEVGIQHLQKLLRNEPVDQSVPVHLFLQD